RLGRALLVRASAETAAHPGKAVACGESAWRLPHSVLWRPTLRLRGPPTAVPAVVQAVRLQLRRRCSRDWRVAAERFAQRCQMLHYLTISHIMAAEVGELVGEVGIAPRTEHVTKAR